MKFLGKFFVALGVLVSGVTHAGNERGGGTSPAPILMPEDVTLECKVKLTQLSPTLHRSLVSRGTQTLQWKKGEYAGNRRFFLKEMDLKHYRVVPVGPHHFPNEEELSTIPTDVSFESYFSLYVNWIRVEVNQEEQSKLALWLTSTAASYNTEKTFMTEAEATDVQTIESKKSLSTRVKKTTKRATDEKLEDQRTLEVICDRQ